MILIQHPILVKNGADVNGHFVGVAAGAYHEGNAAALQRLHRFSKVTVGSALYHMHCSLSSHHRA
jgi:hypothetical protein